ncbi:hypothetical protein [Virgibacillus sp. SK37]|uniref:hypothetical protein n=1 Tax=Virgibacillus sp. SK37 TaxID=403957 RepID=UPI0004D1EEDE|nr:hypothetical protein [Virgibacillus sp. SK37]AIF45670.1 hypothetical protein X953_18960 [Virgibacillus sp. SK37]
MEKVKDNYKKYKYIINFVNKASKKQVQVKYGNKYPDLKLAGDTELLTVLRNGYPVFTETEVGYNLHLIFPKRKGNLFIKILEENKSKLIAYLNQSTKYQQKFTVTYSTFIPGFERNLYKDYSNSLSYIDKATLELDKIRRREKDKVKKQQSKEELIQQEYLLIKKKNELKKQGAKLDDIPSESDKKQIIDPFGGGFLGVAPEKETQKPSPEPVEEVELPLEEKEIDPYAYTADPLNYTVDIPDDHLPF